MKVFIAFALFAACMAAPATRAVDWASVAGKVRAVEGVVTDASNTVRTTANSDNAQVGASIAPKLDAAAVKAREQLARAEAGIKDQTLTEAIARDIFANLRKIIDNLRADLASSIAQLSPDAQRKISETLNSALASVESLANQIYAALSGTTTLAVDWNAVGAKVQKIEQDITRASGNIRKTANDDNAQVGRAIGEKLDAAAVKAREQLQAASDAIKAQTLTLAQAKQIFGNLEKQLGDLRADLAQSVAQLSQPAQQKISAELNNTLESVKADANAIYSLLEKAAILAVDWNAVGAKVQKIEQDITRASGEIRKTANDDNAQVGRAIGEKLDAAAVKAREQLQAASDAIKAQTLTLAQAKQIFGNLEKQLGELRQELSSSVAQLSQAAQQKITGLLESTLSSVRADANGIYSLLEQAAPLAVNWNAVGAKVQEIEQDITRASGEIRKTANDDNAQVGRAIGEKLDAAAVKAREQLQAASDAIKAQTLTEAQAKQIFGNLEKQLGELRQELAQSVAQLSQAAQQKITSLLESTLQAVKNKAQEVYTLLRA